ncbi:MAG: PspC domain-containing protein [Clostridiales bacterium]|jgi:phage shock protein PspC (stress-responsive transcriptional regulator)|nr:PspC domain-containing protein [Clostridiales bacterium]
MEVKKLYKSRKDIKIDGVCAGIGKYFNIDVTLVRLIWLVVALFAGTGVLAYIICMIVIPREPDVVDYTGGGYSGPNHN